MTKIGFSQLQQQHQQQHFTAAIFFIATAATNRGFVFETKRPMMNCKPFWQLPLLPLCSLKPNANSAQLARKSTFDTDDIAATDDISDN